MKLLKWIALLSTLIVFQSGKAQDVKLYYRTFCFDISLEADKHFFKDTVVAFVKDNCKSIKVQKDVFDKAKVKDLKKKFFNFDIADKHKKSYKLAVNVDVIETMDSLKLDVKSTSKWKKRKDIFKKYFKGKNQKTKKKNYFKIKYYKETKIIGQYLCKKAIVESTDGRLDVVWYTEEIDYNWIFPIYYNQIPGTVVLSEVEENGEAVLELLSVEAQTKPVLKITGWE